MSMPPLPPDMIAEIHRLFYEENLNKSEISRQLNISRNVVHKYVPVKYEYKKVSNLESAEKQFTKRRDSKFNSASPPESPLGEPFKGQKTKKQEKTKNKIIIPSLPEAIETKTLPLEASEAGWWWVLSDIHFPFHDKVALETGLQHALKLGLKGILLNGDTIDCLGLSSKFHKKPNEHMFELELECWYAFAQWLRHYFPKQRIIYKRGNHEERFELYLAKFPEFFGVKHIQFHNVMEFEKYGIEDASDGRVVMLGKLPVLHGHEFRSGISAPVNPARGAFLKLKHTVLVGHSHQSSEHPEKDMFDHVYVATSTGCNCTLKPRYDPYNKWNHGGAFVEVYKDKTYFLHNYKIIKGVLR